MLSENPWKILYQRAKEQPYLVVPGIISVLNGYWHRLKFFLLGKRVKIGQCFRVQGNFRILGPGKITIGDNCLVISNILGEVVFYTEFPEATIHIRDNVTMSGLIMQCFDSITIGDYCSIADAFITDSQNHHLSADRRFLPSRSVPKAPVVLDRNIWICSKVVILSGVSIGENSVVGACSLVRHNLPPNGFYAGNPVRFIHHVTQTENHENIK